MRWQRYSRKRTGEIFRFRKLRDGLYAREDGMEFSLGRLNRYYTWERDRVKANISTVTNINGFKVRVKLTNTTQE